MILFDFGVDHDGDSRPDFVQDLERLGLISSEHPELGGEVARRIERLAIGYAFSSM